MRRRYVYALALALSAILAGCYVEPNGYRAGCQNVTCEAPTPTMPRP